MESGSKECATAKETLNIGTNQFTLDNGREEWNGVKVAWPMPVKTIMKVHGRTISVMGMELWTGSPAMKSTLEIGKIISKAALAPIFGSTQMAKTNCSETDTLDTGKKVYVTEKELSIIQMEASMKETGMKISNTAWVYSHLKMELHTKDHLKKIAW